MSRVAKYPVGVPKGVEVALSAAEISVKDVGVAPMTMSRPPMPAPHTIGNPAPLGLLAFGLTTSEL